MSNISQKQKVSDVITRDEVDSWIDGEIITLKADCGRGKSWFIKNILYQKAKAENTKILFLVHRSNCEYQFLEEIKSDDKTNVIHIKTYQSIEWNLIHKNDVDLSQYKYIVSDEFHYFISDSGFNCMTDISLEYILEQANAIKIFMSATCEKMIRYINLVKNIKTRDYILPSDFSYIQSLTFYHKDDSLDDFIKEGIESGEKAIFFIFSAKKAYKLYNKYKEHCLFNCSKSNKEHYKYVDQDKINAMLKNENFDEQFLITTTCFDAGSNIIDKAVKHIIIDVIDVDCLIQCIGRRRILDDDKINIYIKAISNQQLGGFESTMKKKIKLADFLYTHSTAELIDKFYRQQDYSNIIYDDVLESKDQNTCVKKVNQLMYLKKKFDIEEFHQMQKLGDFGYCKYLARRFGFYNESKDWYTYRTIDETNSLESYLESQLEKIMLQVKDRKEFIEKLDVRFKSKLLKTREALNTALLERGYNYEVIQFSTSKIVDGKQKKYPSAWKVVKVGVKELEKVS